MDPAPATDQPDSADAERKMGWTIGRRLAAGYAAMLALMAIVGIVSFTNTSALVTNSEWVEHTHEVITETDAVLASLSDAEAGQRGFVITGVQAYLEPYTAARDEVAVHAAALRELTIDNAVQQARLDELAPLIEEKFAEMQETIDVRSTQGFDAARAIVLTDAGKAVMDEIRGLLGEIRTDEEALLVERAEEADATATATQAVVIIGTGITLLIVIALAVFLTRSITRPINALTTRLREIADGDGDLTQRVDESRKDEIGALAAVFNRFVGNIAALVRQIGESAT